MMRGAGWAAVVGLAASACAGPVTQSFLIGTKDAPLVRADDLGTIGRNVRVEWTLIGPGVKGDALYAFCVPQNPARGAPLETPVFFSVELDSGVFAEHFPKALGGKARMAPPSVTDLKMDDLTAPDGAPAARLTPDWYWDAPTTASGGARRTVLIGTRRGEIIRFHPQRNGFEEVLNVKASVEAVWEGRERDLWIITSPGNVVLHSEPAFGVQKFAGALPAAGTPARSASPFGGMGLSGILGAPGAIVSDRQGWLYTAIGPGPWTLWAMRDDKGKLAAGRLLADRTLDRVEFVPGSPAPGVRAVSGGKETAWRLDGGKAVESADVPTLAALRGYDVEPDFDHEPPSVWVVRGADRKQWRFRYSRATVDDIKCMTLSPDGTKLYGACYPNATIFEYDIAAARVWRRGMHYVHYQMVPDGDWIYSIGYWGIKLMRWDPRQAWTFDYERNYYHKLYPGNTSPWGSLDCNPQLVCKFRYLRHMNLRRPAALAKGADGRWYTGGRDMGINLDWQKNGYRDYGEGIRYAGALFWFDPQEMTIGYETGGVPFEHYRVCDLCAVDRGRYIAMTLTRDDIPFEPEPAGLPPGGVVAVWDTKERKFAARFAPSPSSPRYVEEGAPGLAVVQYSNALAVIDLEKMEVARVVKVPLTCRFSTYASPVRFERGPDERVYFYGYDKDGAALFRIDSRTGQVDAVARGPGISELSGTGHPLVFMPGSTFLFSKDRVYFGTSHLWSVPLERITGPGVPARPVEAAP